MTRPPVLASVPAIVWWVIWLAVALIILILVGLVVHALGGGVLELRAGHFIFELGAT